ncbi:MAG TPA: hypothetical protein ENN24_06285 [Bacteroidetes bacterium]|nr:hypothetical protein [Bacteroidota bacterium]
MSKTAKINAIRELFIPTSAPIVAVGVKHYEHGEEAQPSDLFTVDGENFTLKEVEEMPSNVKTVIIKIFKDGTND